MLRVSVRASAISIVLNGKSPFTVANQIFLTARSRSGHAVHGTRQEGDAFQRLPRVHRRVELAGKSRHFRCGTRKLSFCPPYTAGGMPTNVLGRAPTRPQHLPRFEASEPSRRRPSGQRNGRSSAVCERQRPNSSAARVAALSASVAAKMRLRSRSACSAWILKRLDCSY